MYSNIVNLFHNRLCREFSTKVTKKDIMTVIKAIADDSMDENKNAWNAVFNSRLYNKQSVAYCRLLEYINESIPALFEKV